ncbi:MAG: NAD-dependent epimerase/dehydratase family protein [Gammaproteobacteria bacterium]|nr:NAD-dependent epimerase/dehydratase family protein [Gammaproteobacteria bacterium]
MNLVTGGTGFIGRRLVASLNNDEVVLLVRKVDESLKLPQVECELGAGEIPEQAFNGVENVYHLAGNAHDISGEQAAEIYQRVNVDATIELASKAAKHGVKSFVFVSSVKAGGLPLKGQCASEKDQSEPDGVYGQSKRQAELALLDLNEKTEMQVSIIRPALVYGPGAKGNLQMMLNAISKRLLPPLPDTGNRRSMIYIDDLIMAMKLIASHHAAKGEIFIATDGRQYSTREIYDAICLALGKKVPGWSIPKLLFDVLGLLSTKISYKTDKILGDECYSSEKLNSLGFKPEHTIWEKSSWLALE